MEQITPYNPSFKTIGDNPFFGHRSFHKINYDKVGVNGYAPIYEICNLLQKAGTAHFSQHAMDFMDLIKSGKSWFLSKIEIDMVSELPQVEDMLEIVTWHRGIEGTKAFREFKVFVKDRLVMDVQTQWAHIDFVKKRVVKFQADKFPDFLPYYYTSFDECISSWKEVKGLSYLHHQWLNLRFSDFDINQHLNFSTTFNLIEDFCLKNNFLIKNLKINYKSEITPNFESVKLSWVKKNDILHICITQESKLFTLAEVSVE